MRKAIALKELYNEDFMTQVARKYKNVPNGAEVLVIDRYVRNFYGCFSLIEYDGNLYYVKPDAIKFATEQENEV